jgi:hypothetical protein
LFQELETYLSYQQEATHAMSGLNCPKNQETESFYYVIPKLIVVVAAAAAIVVVDVLVEEVETVEVLVSLDAVEDAQTLHNKQLDARHRPLYLKEASYVEVTYLVSLHITMTTMNKTLMEMKRMTNWSMMHPTLITMGKSSPDSGNRLLKRFDSVKFVG